MIILCEVGLELDELLVEVVSHNVIRALLRHGQAT